MKIKLMFSILIFVSYTITHSLPKSLKFAKKPLKFVKNLWHCRPTSPAADCTPENEKIAERFWMATIGAAGAAAIGTLVAAGIDLDRRDKAQYNEFKTNMPSFNEIPKEDAIKSLQDAISSLISDEQKLELDHRRQGSEYQNNIQWEADRAFWEAEFKATERKLFETRQIRQNLERLLEEQRAK